MRHLGTVLQRLRKANLRLNKDKCSFFKRRLKYLGHVISGNGIHTDPDKIAAVRNLKPPAGVKELRRCIGMASWYRRFVPNFSEIVEPMTALLRKDRQWKWSEEQEKAFEELKIRLTEAPVLACPDFSEKFSLQTDASEQGLGAVLTQKIRDEERVIAYASRRLSKAEENYSVTEKECLAIVWSIRKLRCYLEGYRFDVITDHLALKWINSIDNPTGRIARWALELQQYQFDIRYRRGKQNVVADALSRQPLELLHQALEEESQCKWIRKMLARIRQQPGKYEDYRSESGQLYRRLHTVPEEEDSTPWKLCVAAEHRRRVLKECHDHPTAGHLGIRKTSTRVAQKYYWPGLFREVARYVRQCVVCQKYKIYSNRHDDADTPDTQRRNQSGTGYLARNDAPNEACVAAPPGHIRFRNPDVLRGTTHRTRRAWLLLLDASASGTRMSCEERHTERGVRGCFSWTHPLQEPGYLARNDAPNEACVAASPGRIRFRNPDVLRGTTHRTRRAWLLLLDPSASGTRISCEERRTERGVRGCSSWTHPLQEPGCPARNDAPNEACVAASPGRIRFRNPDVLRGTTHRTRRAWLLLLDPSASGTRISCEERRTERGVRGCSSWTHPLQEPGCPARNDAPNEACVAASPGPIRFRNPDILRGTTHRTRRAWLLLLDTSASGTRMSCEERRTERGVRGCFSWTHPLQEPGYPARDDAPNEACVAASPGHIRFRDPDILRRTTHQTKRAWLFLQGQTATVIAPKGPTKADILEILIKSITAPPHS
ncbi:uncharacterized protein [Drosophila pseudoobscura]|uniref:RNA-directed DNA polymerase n=1 Tax=Drosophila pseudoobscura pseudoobscura TaxID=46245 RepID=A0A6I8W047_DROPS|nr:uncharacterized protein LOC117184088 [Drosophila pseudoobscura]